MRTWASFPAFDVYGIIPAPALKLGPMMTQRIPFDVFAEAVHSEVVKASSDAALLEKLIFPLIRQQRLWDHYPAILHGFWAAVWSSFYMTLCRLFEIRTDRRLASLVNLLRWLQDGERPAQPLPLRWADAREGLLSGVRSQLENIKRIDGRLAVTRSGYLAHRDLTKANYEKAEIAFTELNGFLALSQNIVSEYLLAFLDQSQVYEPSNYGHEPVQFLRWCRLDDYATHHAAWVRAEFDKRGLRDPETPTE